MRPTLLASLLLPALLVINQPASAESQPRYVQVSGNAEVKAKADYLRLYLTITATRKTQQDSRGVVDTAVNRLLAVCDDLGIDRKDIDASQIRNYPQYEWTDKGRRYLGERIDRPLVITLRNTERHTDLVQEVLHIEEASLDNTESGFDDPSALRDKALEQALVAARDKASLMARTLDARLGKVVFINESGSAMPSPVYEMRAMAAPMAKMDAAPAPMLVPEQAISASVEVRFELE